MVDKNAIYEYSHKTSSFSIRTSVWIYFSSKIDYDKFNTLNE
jgi:hypothetical protein